jgi:hypothetical protein
MSFIFRVQGPGFEFTSLEFEADYFVFRVVCFVFRVQCLKVGVKSFGFNLRTVQQCPQLLQSERALIVGTALIFGQMNVWGM